MKLILERADILGALSRVTGVVARNSNIPILNNVLLSASGDTVTIRATDLDMQAVTSCAADIQTGGEITVDAGRLGEIVRAAAAGSQISLEMPGDDPRLLVKSGRSKFRLPVLPVELLPLISDDGWDVEFQVQADVFSDMLSRTLMSVSSETVRYYLCGVLIEPKNGRLRTVATNGHHLTYRNGPDVSGEFREIVPTKAVTEIVRALGETTDDINVRIKNDRLIEVATASVTLRAKVVDGKFPEYERVIPSSSEKSAIVHPESAALAIKRAAIGADDKIRTVVLDFADGMMTAKGRGQSEAMDEVEVEYAGDRTTLAFNSAYLIGILDRAGDRVEVGFGGAVDHTVWRHDDDGLTVLLPIRFGGE